MTKVGMDGFTIVEMVVTAAVLAIVVPLFIQAFIVSQTQKSTIMQQADANSQAASIIYQYPTRTAVENLKTVANPATNVTCNTANDLTITPNTHGTEVLFSDRSDTQKMFVAYPRGCSVKMPVRITAVVTYRNGNQTETVNRALYVTNLETE